MKQDWYYSTWPNSGESLFFIEPLSQAGEESPSAKFSVSVLPEQKEGYSPTFQTSSWSLHNPFPGQIRKIPPISWIVSLKEGGVLEPGGRSASRYERI